MNPSYQAPLYLLPFDHRHCYVAGMFRFTPPLTTEQHGALVDGKHAISDGNQRALDNEVPVNRAAIIIDKQFSTGTVRDAVRKSDATTVSTEKNGSLEVDFENGDAFAKHVDAFQPGSARILLRYHPEDDSALNMRQTMRLKQLADYCRAVGQPFMVELLVPARRFRQNRTVEAICVIQDAGVEPDTWKVEGVDCPEDGERDVTAAEREGRDAVGSSVLGRRDDANDVVHWFEAAAVPRFVGFAVERTTFWNAVTDFMKARVTRAEGVSGIRGWVAVSERGTNAVTTPLPLVPRHITNASLPPAKPPRFHSIPRERAREPHRPRGHTN